MAAGAAAAGPCGWGATAGKLPGPGGDGREPALPKTEAAEPPGPGSGPCSGRRWGWPRATLTPGRASAAAATVSWSVT